MFSCVDCDRLFLYNISGAVYRTAWIFFLCLIIRVSAKGPPKKLNSATFGTKISWPKMMLVFFSKDKNICFKTCYIDMFIKKYNLNKLMLTIL